MWISKLHILNYMSLADSGELFLKPGFTFLVGKNNSGKSALLSTLAFALPAKPHRSVASVPTPNAPVAPVSTGSVEFVLRPGELDTLARNLDQLFIPVVDGLQAPGVLDRLRRDETRFSIEFSADFIAQAAVTWSVPHKTVQNTYVNWRNRDGNWLSEGEVTAGADARSISSWLATQLRASSYVFKAERMGVGTSPFGPNRQLAPNASNLPEVLNVLQGDPARFSRYNELVRRVFPQISQVTVLPQGNGLVTVYVWDQGVERQDLSVPLAESGTGISQVLAMLYVIVSADFARVIAIDEPASFLHPDAVRALFRIFEEHRQHQYVVATHSAEVIAAVSRPCVLLVQKRDDGATRIKALDSSATQDMRTVLAEIGTRLSDVFGADQVLWVEGATEERAFTLILDRVLNLHRPSTAVVGVINTGDFDSRRADFAQIVYERVTSTGGLVPIAVAFVFDRELRSAEKIAGIRARSGNKITFLNRRMYENYLLHENSITAVLNAALSKVGRNPVTRDNVAEWLAQARAGSRYVPQAQMSFERECDAAGVLRDLFWELSEQTLTYEKVEHGVALTEWLLANEPAALAEVVELLRSLFRGVGVD